MYDMHYIPDIVSDFYRRDKGRGFYMMSRGGESILIAEDEALLREMLKETLQLHGYVVFDAEDGDDALSIFHEHRDRIQLLILDVMMPKRNGKEVYRELKKANPDIKTIFISGYPAHVIDTKMIDEEELTFIVKPFIINEFLEKIRELLDT
jgi:two-component system cell cycle sensor histidine kinase/response regulator CckA